MFVYDMGIIDFWKGMILLEDYIKLCPENEEYGNYPSYKELKHFLIKCFMAVKTKETYWEGDIRGLNEIAVSGIPRSTGMEPFRLIGFKQDNNGSSFIVSECCLDIIGYDDALIGEGEIKDFRNYDTEQLLNCFDESYDLTERLFSHALNINKKINKIIKEDVIPVKEDKKNLEDKFNESDYQIVV